MTTFPAKTNYADGDVLTAAQMNDVGDQINSLSYNIAGKNKVLNGDFGIWQRGTSKTGLSDQQVNTADRWLWAGNGTGATRTESRQNFTAGNEIPGYEPQYFYRLQQTVAGSGATVQIVDNRIEDVRTFAGQTVTLSFWAKADSARTIAVGLTQDFNSASGQTGVGFGNNVSLGTTWQRFTLTFTLPSIAGKTIGANSWLGVRFNMPLNTTFTFDLWGVQLEAGSVATPFTTATGNPASELAACQRYYWRAGGDSVYQGFGNGIALNTGTVQAFIPNPTNMRVAPTAIDYGSLGVTDSVTTTAVTSVTVSQAGKNGSVCNFFTGGTALTQYRPYIANANNSTSAYIGFSAEL